MNDTTFDQLPPASRVWAFAADHDIAGEEEAALRAAAEKFMRIWKTKEERIKGCWELREKRFLVVGADESAAPLSGCSVDAMMARLLKLEAETGLKLVDRMRVYYRDREGVVRAIPRAELRRQMEAGAIDEDTLVFDTTISRIESLREGRFEIPLRESWVAQLLAPAS